MMAFSKALGLPVTLEATSISASVKDTDLTTCPRGFSRGRPAAPKAIASVLGFQLVSVNTRGNVEGSLSVL